MTNDPGDGPDEGQNPFKGTPFEQFFAGGMPAGMPDLNQLMGQFQSLMQPYDGPLNWQAADDLARKTVAANPDPSPSQRQKDAVADAVGLADHWLDEATGFSSGVTSTAAWSRAEWIVGTLDVWKVLVEPVAERSVSGLSGALPAEMQASAVRCSASSARRSARCSPPRSDPGWARSPARCSASPTSASRSRRPARPRCCRQT